VTATLDRRPEVVITVPVPESSLRQHSEAPGRRFLDEQLREAPWRTGDVLRLATRIVIGLLGVVGTWYGASGSVVFHDQVAWIAGGVLAVAIGASGAAAWLLSGLGAVARERRWVREQVRALCAGPQAVEENEHAERLVVGEGMRRYHRLDCDVVRGKAVRTVSGRGDDVVLQPCGMCLT
jgi:hypothetical protein